MVGDEEVRAEELDEDDDDDDDDEVPEGGGGSRGTAMHGRWRRALRYRRHWSHPPAPLISARQSGTRRGRVSRSRGGLAAGLRGGQGGLREADVAEGWRARGGCISHGVPDLAFSRFLPDKSNLT